MVIRQSLDVTLLAIGNDKAIESYCFLMSQIELLPLPVPIPDEEKKLTEIFIFTLLCGALKGFMKAFKAFIKHFEVPQRSEKLKIFKS